MKEREATSFFSFIYLYNILNKLWRYFHFEVILYSRRIFKNFRTFWINSRFLGWPLIEVFSLLKTLTVLTVFLGAFPDFSQAELANIFTIYSVESLHKVWRSEFQPNFYSLHYFKIYSFFNFNFHLILFLVNFRIAFLSLKNFPCIKFHISFWAFDLINLIFLHVSWFLSQESPSSRFLLLSVKHEFTVPCYRLKASNSHTKLLNKNSSERFSCCFLFLKN